MIGDPYQEPSKQAKHEGKELPCKYCGGTAEIQYREGRYYVFCYSCMIETHLKTYNEGSGDK